MRAARFLMAAAITAAALAATNVRSAPVGTAFTYQGRLDRSGTPASGVHNFQFKLWDASSAGVQIGATQTLNGIVLTGGLFTVLLDFGAGSFTGSARWLEIAVQGPGDGGFTMLAPREPLTPAPYALFAMNGGGGGGLTLPYSGTVALTNDFAFAVENTGASGTAIKGIGAYAGALFQSTAQGGYGAYGYGDDAGLWGSGNNAGVYGESFGGFGVHGFYGFLSFIPNGTKAGVYGNTTSSNGGAAGVRGQATYGYGVEGISAAGTAVQGQSNSGFGVYGTSNGAAKAGVFGQTFSNNTAGVLGRNESGGPDAQAVYGYASGGAVGVMGISEGNDGVVARSNADGKSGIWAFSTNPTGYGGAFSNSAGGVALLVSGLAQVSTLQILGGSDLAEPFDVAAPPGGGAIEPGMVVAIDERHPGDLALADRAYDTRVAGVISGAHGLAPGMVMKSEGDEHADGAHPVAMTGRVWCRVDASYGAVAPGDLLTTSNTPGHAMRASDPARRAGAILGKAMTALGGGRGLVLVLVSLQ